MVKFSAIALLAIVASCSGFAPQVTKRTFASKTALNAKTVSFKEESRKKLVGGEFCGFFFRAAYDGFLLFPFVP